MIACEKSTKESESCLNANPYLQQKNSVGIFTKNKDSPVDDLAFLHEFS
jgi:hypothetical protein